MTEVEDTGTRRIDLVVLLTLAAALRVPGLNDGLWFDEIWMVVDLIRLPFRDLATTFESDNNHPLYTWLAWGSARIFGEAPWTVRLPAFVFGVASVGAIHAFAVPRVGRLIAFSSALLLAVSSHAIWFSQDARGYTALLFFSIVSSHFLLRMVEAHGRRRDVALFAISLAFAMHTHLTAVFMAMGHAVWWVVSIVRTPADRRPLVKRGLAGFGGAILATLVLYGPILAPLYRFFVHGRPDRPPGDAEWTNPMWMIGEAARSLGFGLGVGLAAIAVAITIGVLGLVRLRREAPPVVVLTLVPALVGAAVLLGMGRNLWPRFFFFLFGLGLVVGLTGLRALTDRILGDGRRARTLFVAIIAVGVLANLGRLPSTWGPKQDFAGSAVAAVEVANGRPILTVGMTGMPFAAYFDEPFTEITTLGALSDLREQSPSGVVIIVTFPIHLEWKYADIADLLESEGTEIGRLRGTLSGGDVILYELR